MEFILTELDRRGLNSVADLSLVDIPVKVK